MMKSPSEFARTVLGARLTQHQCDILDAVARDRRVAVKACHASGKTYSAAIAALWFATRYRNSRVLIIAPGWLTVRSVLWHEIHSLLSRAHLRLPLEVQNQTEIRLDSSLILGLSTNDSARLQGHHAEHMLIIADEAPGITPEFWPAVEGILAGGNTRLLLLGNPTVSSGYFYDAFTRNAAHWTRFSISAFDTPNLFGLSLEQLLELPDAALDTDTAPYLVTRRWVRERHAEWFNGSPNNSPLWQSRVLGEFPSSGSNALIPLPWLEHARQPPIDDGSQLIIGVDPAGPGRDKTAIVACAGGAIMAVATFSDADSRGPVLAWLKRWDSRIRLVRVDSAGLGFYFGEHIRDAGYRTIGVNVAGKPDDPEKFTNLKAQRYWRLREQFQAGEVSGLTDDMLAELAAITWLVDSHGRIAIEGKADVKAALGHSPDLAEALMIALGEGAPVPFEYRAAPAPAPGMGYGHQRSGAVSAAISGCPHGGRSMAGCGTCSGQREDMAVFSRGIARSLSRRGTW
jgi:phage terminase large subunit